jgi:hypothetical protein
MRGAARCAELEGPRAGPGIHGPEREAEVAEVIHHAVAACRVVPAARFDSPNRAAPNSPAPLARPGRGANHRGPSPRAGPWRSGPTRTTASAVVPAPGVGPRAHWQARAGSAVGLPGTLPASLARGGQSIRVGLARGGQSELAAGFEPALCAARAQTRRQIEQWDGSEIARPWPAAPAGAAAGMHVSQVSDAGTCRHTSSPRSHAQP